MPQNQLAQETSPYLLQHKDNPVHWWAWSPEALSAAKAQDKPILLSIGYAACHWCHVMAHESFENAETAALMNQNFINIKVDREERPDIDKVYMNALHALGGQGGWPLTMFLDPDARPFWGGTYFPPESRYGRPSFRYLLTEISRIWRDERSKVESNSQAIVAALKKPSPAPANQLTPAEIKTAANTITRAVDPVLGGLRGAPKFPQAPVFDFLWSAAHAKPVETTLTQISQGGIYDHLGGGIARYSVDAEWLVPHFEKMLYDNAQYVSLLSRVWLKTGSPLYQQRITETVEFVLTAMTTPQNLFASSYDADSEGHEGKYYVWSKAEIDALLGREASAHFCAAYGVTKSGNWEGQNILNRSHHLSLYDPETERQLADSRKILLGARAKRVPPGFDNKVLADWNGLMITALAEAALVFNRSDWGQAAIRTMAAIMATHWRTGELLHASSEGTARHAAIADDYANLITAARALHGLTGEASYITTATMLADALIENHWDEESGALLFAQKRNAELPVVIRSIHDDATPNANGVMLGNFTALHHLAGDQKYLDLADRIAAAFAHEARDSVFAASSYLKHLAFRIDPIQIVCAGDSEASLIQETLKITGLDVVLHKLQSAQALPAGHPAQAKFGAGQQPAIYLCKGNTCAAPARNFAELQASLALLGIDP